MAKKRERLEVIYDMLASIRDSGGALGPTHLLRRSNLSPQMFRDYTDELVEKGLVLLDDDGKRKTYAITDKGYEYLNRYRLILDFIDNFGL